MSPVPSSPPLLQAADLTVRWHERVLLRNLSFELAAGEGVALVGESGSGKTTLLRTLMGLLPSQASATGQLRWWDPAAPATPVDLLHASPRTWRRLRGQAFALVPQEASAALDPRQRAGSAWRECRRAHARVDRETRDRELRQGFAAVGLAASRQGDYPHQWSGGMQQRLLVAMALSQRPALLLADEPTAALDTVVQAQLLALLRELRRERRCALLFVTHDLGIAAQVATRALVLRAGALVETGPLPALFERPESEYTAALVRAQAAVQIRTTAAGAGRRP